MISISKLLSNKHTSTAGLVYIGASAMQVLGPIWLPAFEHQFKITAEWIHGTAALYGFAMAGDASKTEKDLKAVDAKVDQTAVAVATGNTDLLPKPTPPPADPPTINPMDRKP